MRFGAFNVCLQLAQSCDVFSKDIEFDVDHRADTDIAEVGVFKRVRYYGHPESVGCGVAYSERHTVDSYAAFVYSKVAVSCHLLVGFVCECEVCASIGIFHGCTTCR